MERYIIDSMSDQVDWLKRNLFMEVGDGRHTIFWKDHWVEGEVQCVKFNCMFNLAIYKNMSVVDMFRGGLGMTGDGWLWRRNLFMLKEEFLSKCIYALENFSLQVYKSESWVWSLIDGNEYSVKDAYNMLYKNIHNAQLFQLNIVENKMVPLKVSIFA